jgi:hypothetical protein
MCASEKTLTVIEKGVSKNPKGKLVKFPVHNLKTIFIAIPEGASAEDYDVMIVADNSLSGDGISASDAFVYRSSFEREEITIDTICAVEVSGHLLAKKVTFNDDDTITLRSSDEHFSNRTLSRAEVKIKGVYYAVMKF